MPWLNELVDKTLHYLDHYHVNPGQSAWTNQPIGPRGLPRGSYFFRQAWLNNYGLNNFPAFHFFINNYAGQNGLICAVRLEHERLPTLPVLPPPQVLALFQGIQPEQFLGQGWTKNLAHVAIWRPDIFDPRNAAAALPNEIWCLILRDFLLQPQVQKFLAI